MALRRPPGGRAAQTLTMPSLLQQKTSQCFSARGPLAEHVERFTPRPGQQDMARIIAEVLDTGETLFCEAGTGTGKTLAYLAPALLSGRKVIISTGTRHLQDQIYRKDLPVLQQALKLRTAVTVLKGRANYLCLQRLHDTLDQGRVADARHLDLLTALQQWGHRTDSGDFSEYPGISEDFPLFSSISSTTENCLAGSCDHYDDCFVYKARKQAEEAELVIVNHHLLLADMVLREQGAAGMLPDAELIVFDEAHLLADLAAVFFGCSLSRHELLTLLQDVSGAHQKETGDSPGLEAHLQRLPGALQGFRRALPGGSGRWSWADLAARRAVSSGLRRLLEQLRALLEHLSSQRQRGERLAQCHRRCARQIEFLDGFLAASGGANQVQWLETRNGGFTLHNTPLDVAPLFQERLALYEAQSIYTSATLAADQDFQHFADQLGFTAAQACQIASPFRLQEQALLYVPDDLPEPGAADFAAVFLERVKVPLDYSRGRAFVLFTSHKALRQAAARLRTACPWPLLVQGQAPRGLLVQQFRRQGASVLLGTSSFWEGVDVRGEALSSVIIEKLPFASPDDPILQARIAAMREAGQDPFMAYQLPQALISLKQGVGRLIRDARDRGVCTLCDRRIHTRPYGRRVLNMLSAWPRTTRLEEVRNFYRSGPGRP